MRRVLRLLPIPFSIALALPAMADDDKPQNWSLCPAGDAIPAFDGVVESNGSAAKARAERAEQPTEILGDTQSGTDKNLAYQGNVELRRGDQYLNADNLKYDQEADTYVADGNVRYQDSGMRVVAAKAFGDQAADTHQIQDVKYQLVSRRGNGGAERIVMKGPEGALIGSTYSTCAPEDRLWELRSKRIEVNTDSGWGVARGATIRLGKVPVLYVPYIRFPIDDRRHTGLLYPSISNSGRNGLDYRQPIYLNLAPNYDATITPRIMSKRGIQLGGQFRYLYEGGRGELNMAWMPDDDLVERRAQDIANGAPNPFDDPLQSENRGMFQFRGTHNVNSNWQARANVSLISDERYIEDSGNSLNGMSAANLRSTAGLFGQGRHWEAGLMADDWQLADYTLTENSLPYNRVPRLYLNWDQPVVERWLTAGLQAETVRFDHGTKAGGSRLDLKPYVSMPLRGASYYITPTLAWRYTSYRLDSELAAILPGTDDNPSRSLPIATLDAGLFFDRETEIKGSRFLQTLEPRLFYLNTPYRDQSDLPLFDTRPFTFSWGQLFRDNRYTGPDRQTDANQLTVAVTTRLIRQTDGLEKLTASVGQIFYFDESRVTLPGELPVDEGKSAWVADANYFPNDRLSVGASYQWNPNFRREDLASLRMRYLVGNDGVVNLNYRYRARPNGGDLLEQADLSFLYPITPSWSAVGRYYYSLQDDKPLEILAGVQWDSCCLAVRAVARRYVRNREGELDNSLQVEFILKGLGSAGRDTEGTLRRAILGYYRDDLYLVPPSNTTPNPDDNDLGPDTMP